MMIMTSQGLGEASGTSPLHANFTYSAYEMQCNALNRQRLHPTDNKVFDCTTFFRKPYCVW